MFFPVFLTIYVFGLVLNYTEKILGIPMGSNYANPNLLLTAKFLKQGYWYNKLHNIFSRLIAIILIF